MAKTRLSHHALIRYVEHKFNFDFSDLRLHAAIMLGYPSINHVDDRMLVPFIEDTLDLRAIRETFYDELNRSKIVRETPEEIYKHMKDDLVALISKETRCVKTVLPPEFLYRKASEWGLHIVVPQGDLLPEAAPAL